MFEYCMVGERARNSATTTVKLSTTTTRSAAGSHPPPATARLTLRVRSSVIIPGLRSESRTDMAAAAGADTGRLSHGAGWRNRGGRTLGRIAAAQFRGNLRRRKPGGQIPALHEPLAEFGARDGQHARAGRCLILRQIGAVLRHVNQPPERHDTYPKLVAVPAKQVLGGVGLIEGAPTGILAGPGVIPAHDEMRRTVVFADDGVPERLA